MLNKLTILFFICLFLHRVLYPVYADEIDDLQKQIDILQESLNSTQKANNTNKQNYASIQKQIIQLKQGIGSIEYEYKQKDESLVLEESRLEKTKDSIAILSKNMYMNARDQDLQMLMFIGGNANDPNTIIYGAKALEDQKNLIQQVLLSIETLEKRKNELINKKERLAKVKDSLSKDAQFLAVEIDKANNFEAESKKKIAELSAKQQNLLASRSGGSQITSIGSVPVLGDAKATIAYKSQAPSNSFAVFSFGAYSHRKGMSQYGAKGRAIKGQNYKDILKFYYGKDVSQKDTGGTIKVENYGDMEFESKYLMGIAEMPSSFPKEALKAQAVAARTYAYRYKKDGKSICITEACQVFNNEKANNIPNEWKAAVEETKGEIIEDVTTFYASTHGGYVSGIGWDSEGGVSGGDWTTKAYEVIGESPWFYRAWYRQGYRDDGASCGRSHPWLSMEEMSDIINAWIVKNNDTGADTNKILPITINSCSVGGVNGDAYSMSEMKDYAQKAGGSVNNITSVRVEQNNGQTSKVIFNTNRGEINISGVDFKQIFNLRAPGYIAIRQSQYTFFNIEKKD